MGCGDLERNDVDTLSYALNIACIGGVPERGGVALVRLRGKEELEGNICGGWGIVEE